MYKKSFKQSIGITIQNLFIAAIWVIISVIIVMRISPIWAIFLLILIAFMFVRMYVIRRKPFRKRNYAFLRLRPLGGVQWKWVVFTFFPLLGIHFSNFILHYNFISSPELDQPLEQFKYADAYLGWLPIVFYVCILGPLIEEVFCRGRIQRSLEIQWGPMIGIITTAMLFSLLHLNPSYFLLYFFAGLIFGFMVYLTRSLWAGIVLHAFLNTFIISVSFLNCEPIINDEWIYHSSVVLIATIIASLSIFTLIAIARRLWTLRISRSYKYQE